MKHFPTPARRAGLSLLLGLLTVTLPGGCPRSPDMGGNSNQNGSGNDNQNSGGGGNENVNGGSNSNNNSDGGGNGNSNTNGGSNGNSNTNGGPMPDPEPPTGIVFNELVRTGDGVPGRDGVTFTYFSNPIVDAEGRVAFWAGYSTANVTGQPKGGLFVSENGVLRRVIDDDPATTGVVPGEDQDAFFGDFPINWDGMRSGNATVPWYDITWGLGGRLIFVSELSAAPLQEGLYRWRASDANIIPVANQALMGALFESIIPAVDPTQVLSQFWSPAISDGNIVNFVAKVVFVKDDGTFGNLLDNNTGTFFSTGTALTLIADPQLTPPGGVPDQDQVVMFRDFVRRLATAPDGHTLVSAPYLLGSGNRGLYLTRNGSLERVIDNAPGRTFPGLAFGITLNADGMPYDGFAIGNDLRMAIDTKITNGGDTHDTVIYFNGTQFRELSGAGAVATQLLSGVNDDGQLIFLANGRPFLGHDAQVTALDTQLPAELASASLRWESTGAALNNQGRALLKFSRLDSGGNPVSSGLVFWNSQRHLLVCDPATDTPIPDFDVLFTHAAVEIDRPGRSGTINDLDHIVFRMGSLGNDGMPNTPDDVQAIILGKAD